ncbi:methylated-DNA--[protein]-cysteine S-methyltransferase [Formosa sediminum]|uniref:Methylated-DNA--protein-cysteine methyltransferase n=1 Tax=Formosa sediminum TaxID=2594004 RepID=A0A516GNL4_9FLAO|nr:methylated-DNA--[protein]-cysteine S-methyltransferase [Formosa sediminum]QDO93089.1 methylated-DNA--[protein]-cysteine S-methyltransferase [Formosa sediminum]
MDTCVINTPLGFTQIEGDTNGIISIKVLNYKAIPSKLIPDSLKSCAEQLQDYFEGNRTNFSIKQNPKGTDFQKKVWDALTKIPYGKTLSYLELSKQLGDVKAIRAVANANGKNPLWIVVPCHRVIGTDGSLTGYAGGLHRKQWLLNHESPVTQQSLF